MDNDLYMARVAPLVYDQFWHHNLPVYGQSCRWGPKVASPESYANTYRVYYSQQANEGEGQLPLIISANVDILKSSHCSPELVAQWTRQLDKAPLLSELKVIIHPGDVNKLRDLPSQPEVLASATDGPDILLWNMARQPDRKQDKDRSAAASASTPDLVLARRPGGSSSSGGGHGSDSSWRLDSDQYKDTFALNCCSVAPLVASGAADRVIVIWDLRDADASSLSATGISNSAASAGRTNDACGSSKGAAKDGKEGSASEGKGDDDGDGDIVMEDGPGGAQQQHEGVGGGGPTAPPELEGRHVLHGHSGTVQDLSWRPGSETELVSCATDESIIMWDLRASKGPAGRVSRAHAYRSSDARTTELTAVEWQGHGGHLIASGADDGTVRVWDARKLSNAEGSGGTPNRHPGLLYELKGHADDVLRLEWCPHAKDVLASGSKDSLLYVWKLDELSPVSAKGSGGSTIASAGGLSTAPSGSLPSPSAAGGSSGKSPLSSSTGAVAGSGIGGTGGIGGTASGAGAAGGSGGRGGAHGRQPKLRGQHSKAPAGVMFSHRGHKAGEVVDFQWHPLEPWVILSMAVHTGDDELNGGCSLQAWAPSTLLRMSREQALRTLRPHESYILSGET